MSPFEYQNLQIESLQLVSYMAADGIALIALLAAIVGGYVGYRNLRIVRLSLLLFLEQDLAARRRSFHDIQARMRDGGSGDELEGPLFEEAKESYFTTFERLASLALAQYFSNEELCPYSLPIRLKGS